MSSQATLANGQSPLWDCLVIGGGPAGLTAAIYLARFHLAVTVVDHGESRLSSVPLTRNHAGFPEGIAGADLLARMRAHAVWYGVSLQHANITRLAQQAGVFHGWGNATPLTARSVLLATGVVNRRPAMATALHDAALRRGLLRYCPVCDAFEVTDRPIAVIGTGERGTAEAQFLRSYSAEVSLIAPSASHDLNAAQQARLADAGIRIFDGPIRAFQLLDAAIELELADGWHRFATMYPALGSQVRSDLARDLGATVSNEGCLIVDAHQRTSVAGLYAAGDVVLGLDQISHAMGQGGVAATTIRNDLAARHPLRR